MGLFDRKQSGIASLDQGRVDDTDLAVAVHIRERLKERGSGDPGFMPLYTGRVDDRTRAVTVRVTGESRRAVPLG